MHKNLADFVLDVTASLHESVKELSERKNYAAPHEQHYFNAKLDAYHEMLAIMRLSADEFEIAREKVGL